jgi:hypothetical protein
VVYKNIADLFWPGILCQLIIIGQQIDLQKMCVYTRGMRGSRLGKIIKELISNCIAEKEAGPVESSSSPPSGRDDINGYYLMLRSWASISSVVVMIFELAW